MYSIGKGIIVILLTAVWCTASPPNILVFLADDLGYGDLSSSGHPTSQTPAIDKLAHGGKVFTQFYVASPVCSPSRAALLTGRYSVRTGVYPGVFAANSIGGLPSSEKTLPSLLREGGYETGLIGKWHLGVGENHEHLPTNHGFDLYYGVPYSHDMCPCTICFPPNITCFSKCRSQLVSCPLFDGETIVEQPTFLPTLTDKFTNKAVDFITTMANKNTPFFLMVAYHQTHHPQFASEQFYGKSQRGVFGDALMEMDNSLGLIMQALDKNKITDNTLVWFTSDNGPSLNLKERGGCAGLFKCGKATTYEGGMHVPGIASWQGRIKPGRSNELISTIDILPTSLSLANITSNHTLDGYDMTDVLFGNQKSPRNHYYYFSQSTTNSSAGPYAVRYEEYKAHFYTQGAGLSGHSFDADCYNEELLHHDPPLLFYLSVDPNERFNLAADPEYSVILETLQSLREQAINIRWGESEINRGTSDKSQPCCSTQHQDNVEVCQPFPQCCDCKT